VSEVGNFFGGGEGPPARPRKTALAATGLDASTQIRANESQGVVLQSGGEERRGVSARQSAKGHDRAASCIIQGKIKSEKGPERAPGKPFRPSVANKSKGSQFKTPSRGGRQSGRN